MAPIASAVIGSTNEYAQPDGDRRNGTYPVAGNQPSSSANTSTNIMASQNPGSAKPRIATTWRTRSTQPRYSAAATPKPIETIAATMVAPRTSEIVTGTRLSIASTTSSLVKYDVPKSPWKTSRT